MNDFTGRHLLMDGAAVSPTATLPAVPLMADTIRSETPFPRLELWEDGRRIPDLYKPDNFEWWYFDAQLTDGRTLVLVFYIDQDAGERRFVYRVQATVASPNGQRVAAGYVTHQDVSISRERPEIHIGKSFLRGDLDTYRMVMDASDLGKLGLDVTIRRTFPPRVSPANRESIVQADKIIGWVCPVPRGELTGTIMMNGETAAVKGVAYHDHNWGTTTMGSVLHHWIWGRAAIGPYTAVYASEYPNQPYENGRTDGLQQFFIASEREVLINVEGSDAARVTAVPAANPDPRNGSAYYCPRVRFEVEKNGRRVALEADAAQFLGSFDLATESKFLSPEEIARAARMEHRPWYSHFVAAPVTLSITATSNTETYTGQGVIEFMDFHLNA
ncbi:MAG: hypothetical protein JWO19_3016 [Bryobacterales bacterium]|jgi:hypothetical protein|nr:hypothetical protein [Bryobacterales bacterium]